VTQPKINPTSISGAQTIAGKPIFVDNNAANPFPQVGATSGASQKYGGDDYASYKATDVLFAYDTSKTPNTLSWWDNPDQTKDAQSEAATCNSGSSPSSWAPRDSRAAPGHPEERM
jgi:hypothetical protein